MMSRDSVQVRMGGADSVLEIKIGRVEVDVPRSVGYFGGLAAAVGLGLIEPPLAVFIAAVPVFKALTNTGFPPPLRMVGEVLEGAAQPVGSDADGVVQLADQSDAHREVVKARSGRKAARHLAAT